jgi:putative endonuclease
MDKGSHYELQAAQWLQARGLQIVDRNYHCKLGEIDLVCRDGQILVFVEVRYRKHPGYASAAASVTPAKQRKIIRTAQLYLQRHRELGALVCRFDVVAIAPTPDSGEDGIQWLQSAFTN